MKNKTTLWLLCVLFTGIIFAQERECSTMENLEYRIQQNPNLQRTMADIETFTQAKVAEMQNNRIDGNIITLPVVVHILYRNNTENISVAQIQSQLDVLNEDFRRTNPDADNSWSQAADTEIQFCLATVDPNGNATSGITRKSTTRQDWGTSDAMKSTATGGINPWNTSEYLNMWVVPQMTSGGRTILGYAQFPGGSAATDGVVMAYNYFGRVGNVSAPFDGGRTTTHEVGHFLNLRHIWGDSNCGNDFVNDTPTHQTSNSGCPAGRVSCGSVDMYQNYMDYSNDVCMNLFTQGQKNRMRAVLAAGGFRRSLALSDKCGGATAPTCTDGIQNGDETGIDCGGSSCTPCQTGNQYCASQGNSVTDEFISRVQLGTINNTSGGQLYSDFTSVSSDLAKGTAYSITVTPTWTGQVFSEGYAAWIDYNDDGDFNDSGEQIFSRAASQTTPVSGNFTVPSGTSDGTKRLRVSMKYNGIPSACETFDFGEVEDYTVNIITGSSSPSGCTNGISSFPYNQGFESNFGSWSQVSGDDFNWTRRSGSTPSNNTGPSSASEGSQYVFMESSAPNFSTKRAILQSPCFNLSGLSQATFSFKYHMFGASAMGNLQLAVSTNNGSSWTTIWTEAGNQGNSWQDASVDLSAYNGSVLLRFDGTTGTTWQGDMAVDDLSLTDGPVSIDKCAGVLPYVSSQSYSPGEQVTFNGTLYERTSTGWINLGPCGTARAVDGDIIQYLDAEVSVYPNPIKGNMLFVKSSIDDLPFTVYNMIGQEVAKGTSANGVNVNSFKAGLYLIKFDINNKIETRKFIKQ